MKTLRKLSDDILNQVLHDKYKLYFSLTVLKDLQSSIGKRKINQLFSGANCCICDQPAFLQCPRVTLSEPHKFYKCDQCVGRRQLSCMFPENSFWWCPQMEGIHYYDSCPFCKQRWLLTVAVCNCKKQHRLCFRCKENKHMLTC